MEGDKGFIITDSSNSPVDEAAGAPTRFYTYATSGMNGPKARDILRLNEKLLDERSK